MSGRCSRVLFEHTIYFRVIHMLQPSRPKRPPSEEVIFPVTATDTVTPYYSVCSETDPVARARRAVRIAEYDAWRACLPADRDPEVPRDWTEHAATLTRSLGSSARFIAANLEALQTLDRLPTLRALVEDLRHLDMLHLRKIDDALLGIALDLQEDPEFWEILDDALADYLTPTRPNQLLPQPGAITQRIRGVIRALEDQLDTSDESDDSGETEDAEPEVRDSYRTHEQQDGSVTTEANFDQVTAAAVDEAVRAYAKANECSRSQALAALILRNVTVKIVLNVYRAKDVENAPGHLQPVGWLTQEATGTLAELATKVRDVDAAADVTVDGYQANAVLRAYLEGRDGVCRWPGCTRPAIHSQKDHRVDYADGGPTAASNMVSLCQHHHNRKTDGLVRYFLQEHTGDVYWLFADGSWTVDLAEGPLAPRQRRWVQTLAQRRRRREERARRKTARNIFTRRPRVAVTDDDPPPF